MDWTQHLNGIDLAFAVLLLLSLVVGLIRGLIYEVLSVAGWVVAYLASRWAAPIVSPSIPVGSPGSSVNLGVSLVACFVGVLFAWGILTWLLQKLVQASPLRPADRAMGGVFGLVRGVLIGLVVCWVVGLTPLAQGAAWRSSAAVRVLGLGVGALAPSVASLAGETLGDAAR